jgi:hypothetical protein
MLSEIKKVRVAVAIGEQASDRDWLYGKLAEQVVLAQLGSLAAVLVPVLARIVGVSLGVGVFVLGRTWSCAQRWRLESDLALAVPAEYLAEEDTYQRMVLTIGTAMVRLVDLGNRIELAFVEGTWHDFAVAVVVLRSVVGLVDSLLSASAMRTWLGSLLL